MKEMKRFANYLSTKYIHGDYNGAEFNNMVTNDSPKILEALAYGLHTRNKGLLTSVAFTIDTIEKKRVKLGTF